MKTMTKVNSDSIARKARPTSVELAMSVVFERIGGLSAADRADLLELVQVLSKTDDPEERERIYDGLVEILDVRPTEVRPMQLATETSPAGLEKWQQFVGEKLREARKAKKLTQERLAEKSGLPQSHISRIENGEHSPSHKTVVKLAKALRIPVASLDPSDEE